MASPSSIKRAYFPSAFIALALALSLGLSACASSGGPYQGMNLDEVYQIGLEHLENEDWGDAIEAFETVVFGAEGLAEAGPARYYLGRAFFGDEQYLTAAAEFERFLERFPNHTLAPQAALGVCESYVALSPIIPRDQGDTERAYRECQAAALDFAGTEAAQEAAELRERMWQKLAEKVYHSGNYYFSRNLYDSAILYFEDVVENYSDTEAAPRALARMYEAYQEIGYEEEAEETREQLLRDYPDSEAAQGLDASDSAASVSSSDSRLGG
ncbi:MAG: outer membrane protein assembly factor BamD [Gemmatimonadota bacterium]